MAHVSLTWNEVKAAVYYHWLVAGPRQSKELRNGTECLSWYERMRTALSESMHTEIICKANNYDDRGRLGRMQNEYLNVLKVPCDHNFRKDPADDVTFPVHVGPLFNRLSDQL